MICAFNWQECCAFTGCFMKRGSHPVRNDFIFCAVNNQYWTGQLPNNRDWVFASAEFHPLRSETLRSSTLKYTCCRGIKFGAEHDFIVVCDTGYQDQALDP